VKYVSTRGSTPPQSFSDILLSGVAPDGGLYLPEAWPQIPAGEIARYKTMSYEAAALDVLSRFVGASFSEAELKADIEAAYASFDARAIAPLVEIGPRAYLLELFHGPTLAFKDIALQLLGRLFARQLEKQKTHATVVVATSGDTGSAAIAALGGLPGIDLFVLYPHGRISEVQRRQMTASGHKNAHTVALQGTFDDAQALVKALFSDEAFSQTHRLTAVNSINFARIAAQSVYYFTTASKLGAAPTFVVPTGNFGDVFAGEAAARMGLPIEKLVVATNANDILARALNDGVYESGAAKPSLSPSMDIQVASNFERALFEASGRDSRWTASGMDEFRLNHKLKLPTAVRGALAGRYAAFRANDDETLATIERVFKETGRLIDPHTAVAAAAAYKVSSTPKVVLSTAHPAKFPDAISRATGQIPPVPPQLSGLYSRPEKMDILPVKMPLVRAYIEARLAHHESRNH
jgi:threonine synthase